MVTKLESVANDVAQEKISSGRLRNDEIRKQMYNPWSAPQDAVATQTAVGDTPAPSLQNVFTSTSSGGSTPTTADIYSALRSNYGNTVNSSEQGGNQTEDNSGDSGGVSLRDLPGWSAPAAGTAASILGAGPWSGLASAAVNGARGDWGSALGNVASFVGNKLNLNSIIPGGTSALGTLVGGLANGKTAEEIGKSLANGGIGTALGMANPIAGAAYSLARLFGFDPVQGTIDHMQPDYSQRDAAGYNGGYWGGGPGNRGSWNATNGENGTNNTYSGSGAGNVTGPGSNYSSPVSNDAPSANPATSYGGWTPTAPPTTTNDGGESTSNSMGATGWGGYGYSGMGSSESSGGGGGD